MQALEQVPSIFPRIQQKCALAAAWAAGAPQASKTDCLLSVAQQGCSLLLGHAPDLEDPLSQTTSHSPVETERNKLQKIYFFLIAGEPEALQSI